MLSLQAPTCSLGSRLPQDCWGDEETQPLPVPACTPSRDHHSWQLAGYDRTAGIYQHSWIEVGISVVSGRWCRAVCDHTGAGPCSGLKFSPTACGTQDTWESHKPGFWNHNSLFFMAFLREKHPKNLTVFGCSTWMGQGAEGTHNLPWPIPW